MTKAMNKAQLIDENIMLRAQCDVLENKCLALGSALDEMARDRNRMLAEQLRRPTREEVEDEFTPGATNPGAFANYWDYVREAKAAQRGQRVVGYLSREQWQHARGAH